MRALAAKFVSGGWCAPIAWRKMVNMDQVFLGKARTTAVVPCNIAVHLTLGSEVSIPHQDNNRRTAVLRRPPDINVRSRGPRGIQAASRYRRSGAYDGTRVLPDAACAITTLDIFWLIGTDRAERNGGQQEKQD